MGRCKFVNINFVKRGKDLVVMNRNGEIHVLDEEGRNRGKYPIPYGANIKVKEARRSSAAISSPSGTPSPSRSWPRSPGR